MQGYKIVWVVLVVTPSLSYWISIFYPTLNKTPFCPWTETAIKLWQKLSNIPHFYCQAAAPCISIYINSGVISGNMALCETTQANAGACGLYCYWVIRGAAAIKYKSALQIVCELLRFKLSWNVLAYCIFWHPSPKSLSSWLWRTFDWTWAFLELGLWTSACQ